METEQVKSNPPVVDDEIVSFFDLLARFDFEDRQRESSVPASDSPVLTPLESR